MDEIDRRIVDELRRDARIPFSDLGRRLGHPVSTVKRRVEGLLRRGEIVGFTAVLGAHMSGSGTEAVVEVFCRGNVPTAALSELMRETPEVVSAYSVAGAADAVIVLRANNNDELGRMIESIRSSPHIERTRTSIVLHRL